eukprot:5022617-Karenia_brevis.AAC.1
MHITIAFLLYADDCTLPADSTEDLALSARIFTDFRNDMQIYISVPKTVLTVFCPESDTDV